MKSYSLGSPSAHKWQKGDSSFRTDQRQPHGLQQAGESRRCSHACEIAVDKINVLPVAPEFMLHTGDISHLSKPEEFDNVDQILRSAKA